MSRLRNGQPFPPLEVPAVGGGTISLPDDLAGSYGVVLIYRGSWCPYCNAQLAAFSRALDALAELGVKVVALSVDDEETSAALVAKHKLRFPVGHSVDAGKVAAATGAYVNDESALPAIGRLRPGAGRDGAGRRVLQRRHRAARRRRRGRLHPVPDRARRLTWG